MTYYQEGNGMDFYYIFNIIGQVAVWIYNLCHIPQKVKFLGGLSQKVIEKCKLCNKGFKLFTSPWFWAFIETVIITLAQYNYVGLLNSTFGRLVGTGANYFGLMFAVPIIILIVCFLLRIDYYKQMDMITPAFPLGLIFVKIACFTAGCCRGVPFEYGIYNPVSDLVEFPAQLLESAVALGIFIFLLCIKKKLAIGTVFPVYLMAYSTVRFFTEFTRCEPAVLGPLKTYQILCIFGVLVGYFQFVLAQKYNKKQGSKQSP